MQNKNLSSKIVIPKERMAIIFTVSFFLLNIFQQYERREDYPFTYFGMYKEGRHETKNYFRFFIYYRNDSNRIDIATFGNDHYYMRKKLRSILLKETYLPNNDALSYPSGLSHDSQTQELLLELIRKDVLPQILKRKLNTTKAKIEVVVNFWDDLSPDNARKPDKNYVYYEVLIKDLLEQRGQNE